MSIQEQLKKARKRAGLTQGQVEEATNIKANTISNWEKGVSKPDVDKLAMLCNLYGTDPNELYRWDSNDDPHGSTSEVLILKEQLHKTPGMRTLFSAAEGATKEDIEKAATFLEIAKKKSGIDQE